MSTDLTIFQRKLAEHKAVREAEAAKEARSALPVAPEGIDADLIPEEQYSKSDADKEIDQAIKNIDVLDAYARWCGKMTPKVLRNQRENIMVSCPTPGHLDKVPSAWVNLDKQTWFCGSCQTGGDAHDIAAFHYGYPVPGYKVGSVFRELRTKMALDFGYSTTVLPGGVVIVNRPDEDESEIASDVSADPIKPVKSDIEPIKPEVIAPAVTVMQNKADEITAEEPSTDAVEMYDDGDEMFCPPSLDWRSIVPEDTFLYEYMKATMIDDVAEEFHFWNGLLAVGFALGRRVSIMDKPPVYGNLFICTIGTTGSGKTKARGHLDQLLYAALPADAEDPNSCGVVRVNNPGSGEAMIDCFEKINLLDPSNPKGPSFHSPVTGLIDYNEMSALMTRVNRIGSVLESALIGFYDMGSVVETESRGHGKSTAVKPFASLLTSTQPRSLKVLLNKGNDDSGFLNRWVFVAGPDKKHYSFGGAAVDMTPAVKPLQDILGWSASFRDDDFVTISTEAYWVFDDFFHNVLEPAKKHARSSLINRIDLLCKKLILLFSANKMETIVSVETINEVIACYPYLMACYGIPEANIGSSTAQEVEEAVKYQIERQFDKDKNGLTLNRIGRALRSRKYERDVIIKAVDVLVKMGDVEIQNPKPGAKGRPVGVRYRHVA